MQQTMRLVTLHGRNYPRERLSDWGFDGPTLENVVAIHWTYGNLNIFFHNDAAASHAQRETGWSHFEDCALTMRFERNLLVMRERDGHTRYYGDWEVQSQTDSTSVEAPVLSAGTCTLNKGTVDFKIDIGVSVAIAPTGRE
ncbi:MAG: hypothetical protein IPK81_11325 [Rhodospirillales bacterium]|nr:MAG: hypothetical protein IPK81_11325 [Rhodospirillales bacterium]